MTLAFNKPLVTICIPTYNSARTVAATLESVSAQTYRNLQILVVDNASGDATLDIVRHYAERDDRITVHAFAENVGFEGNCTRCFGLADGEYTAIYHSDDVYEPEIVAREVMFLEEHKDAGAVFTLASYIDVNGAPVPMGGRVPEIMKKALGTHLILGFAEAFNAVISDTNFFMCPSAMARTAIYRDHVQVWDGERFGTSADLWVWLRILERFPVGILLEPLMRYRLSAGQGSVQVNHLRTGPSNFSKVIDHYLAQEWVAPLVDPVRREDYLVHDIRDRLKRARNCLITGDHLLARQLTGKAWSRERFRLTLVRNGRPGYYPIRVRTWFAGAALHLVIRSPLQRLLGKVLFHYKYTRRYRKLNRL